MEESIEVNRSHISDTELLDMIEEYDVELTRESVDGETMWVAKHLFATVRQPTPRYALRALRVTIDYLFEEGEWEDRVQDD